MQRLTIAGEEDGRCESREDKLALLGTLLAAGKQLSADEIVARLKISKRTVYLLLDELRERLEPRGSTIARVGSRFAGRFVQVSLAITAQRPR